MSPTDLAVAGAALAASAGGAFGLRRAWRDRTPAGAPWVWIGWSGLAAGLALWIWSVGPEIGVALALTWLSVIAAVAIVPFMERRTGRKSSARPGVLDPSDRVSKTWRGWMRGLLAGPIAGVAALGLGLGWAVSGPGGAQDRLIIGGLLVPVLWAAGMAWTLSDDRIFRALAVLIGTALVGFGFALAPTMLGD